MRAIALAVALAALGSTASAEMLERTGTFAGLRVAYKVVLPTGFDASKTYPLVLVFTGGPQTMQIATGTVENDWRKEAERRGYIVIAPASPNGELFFEGADRIFPAFLDQNQVHRLKAQEIDLSRRLFDEIESCGK